MVDLNEIPKRLVVGITGASGMLYAVRFLKALPANYEIHLVFSDIARKVMKMETGWDTKKTPLQEFIRAKYKEEPSPSSYTLHGSMDHFAAIASGSFPVEGMAVIPCSMKTLAGIANGYSETLIERAADVNLKEKRPVILLTREAPYNRIHLRNMLTAHDAGATILPASPAFYHKPQSIEEMIDFIIARAYKLLGIPNRLLTPWGEKTNV